MAEHQPTDAIAPVVTVTIPNICGKNVAFVKNTDSPVSDIYDEISTRFPVLLNHLILLTTNSRRNLLAHATSPISTLLNSSDETFLPLRFTIPLCGGKGGFGSQLRAAGGRMSSRKKRNQGEQNSSSRNLDGRRLRTVNEAKHLAEFLAIKPEMEKREKEERRKRWADIVDAADRKEDEIRAAKGARLDGKWVEDKEEAEQKTRDAIALFAAQTDNVPAAQSESESPEPAPAASSSKLVAQKTMFGWDDEDDEFMSDSDEEEEISEEDAKPVDYEGKGKGKA